jgi:3-methyladenine DNA glycosylase Tag
MKVVGIIRNRLQIAAVVKNAQAFPAVEKRRGHTMTPALYVLT